jgi:hypothetical protein
LRKVEQYYALCAENERGESEVAFFDLGYEEGYGQMVGMSVYTAADGDLQRENLSTYVDSDEPITIAPVSHQDLLDAMNRGYPSSIYLDGRKLAGSVFKGMLKTELGLPIKHPRLIRLEDPDAE